jgi:hypothetical protein
MKAGGWLDTLLFAGGAIAPVAALVWWGMREQSANSQMQIRAASGFAGVALLVGAGVYQAAQRRRLRAGILFPRRGGAVISVTLGVAFPFLCAAIGQALEPAVGNLGVVLVFLLPWVLSRAQWTTTPPESE